VTDDVEWEYGFESPQLGLMYVTTNDLLVEVMHSSRPHVPLYRRPATEWTRVTEEDPT
jgi:hypothetical protein